MVLAECQSVDENAPFDAGSLAEEEVAEANFAQCSLCVRTKLSRKNLPRSGVLATAPWLGTALAKSSLNSSKKECPATTCEVP
ncbi:MAG: hypothetical protein RIQ81_1944 [Pseudomonadota bacterium]